MLGEICQFRVPIIVSVRWWFWAAQHISFHCSCIVMPTMPEQHQGHEIECWLEFAIRPFNVPQTLLKVWLLLFRIATNFVQEQIVLNFLTIHTSEMKVSEYQCICYSKVLFHQEYWNTNWCLVDTSDSLLSNFFCCSCLVLTPSIDSWGYSGSRILDSIRIKLQNSLWFHNNIS